MQKIKVSEATNRQLDWLVAVCEGRAPSLHEYSKGGGEWFILMQTGVYRTVCAFTDSAAQMWPVIEREKISTLACDRDWEAQSRTVPLVAVEGPTSLIAAARCYVVSKLGEEVEVPDELI